MSNAIVRRICVLLLLVALVFSGLTALTAVPVAAKGATQGSETPSASIPASDQTTQDVSLDAAIKKVESSLQESVLSGAKDDVEVLVFSTDVPALARVMNKYPHEGLLGPNAEKTSIPTAIYLKLPAQALQEVAKM
ncbi:MAG: hypothetical protein E6G55_12730, partial [Actinobacteria bacterium]